MPQLLMNPALKHTYTHKHAHPAETLRENKMKYNITDRLYITLRIKCQYVPLGL